jgi:Flp pilus assembly protein TadG
MRTTATNRPSARQSGQGLVEMALILPVLLLLILGTVECFRAFNLKHVITDAVREGARHAVVQDPSISADSVEGAILWALGSASIPAASTTISFDTVPPPLGHWRETGAMQTVTVSVPYRFGFLGPLVHAATGADSIVISMRVSMRNE